MGARRLPPQHRGRGGGIGEGAELQAPLARVVIGGLVASPLVTLVLVPSVYTLFDEGWSGLRRGAAHAKPEQA